MGHLPWDAERLTTLRTMNKIKPFKLVFLLEVSGCSGEEMPQGLVEALDSAVVDDRLKFLGSPPTIRSARFRQQGWGWDAST